MKSLPSGWISCTIAELGAVRGGRQRSPHLQDGRVRPYLRVANVLDGWIDTSDVLKMPFTDDEYREYVLEAGDVLLNEGQSLELVGRSAVYRGEPPSCCFQNTLIRFRPNKETDSDYANALFEHLRTKGCFTAIAARTTSIAHLGTTRFASLRVACPGDSSERRAIGRALANWDEMTERLDQLVAAKRRFRHGLRQELLTGKRRFKEFDGTNWRRIRIGDLFEEVSRPVEWSDEATYQLISIRRRSGGVFLREARKGSEIKTKQLFEVRGGDFLISKMQVVHGALGIVRQSFDGMHVSGSYVVLTNKSPDRVRTQFFDYVTRLPRSYRQALLASYGVHIEKMTFNLPWYLRSAISIPSSLDEQDRVVATLDSLEREVELLMLLKGKLDQQRKGVAELLLTGKVRIPA